MIDYLNNGGNLYIESSNIGIDYNGTEFSNYLGIIFQDDGGDNEVASLHGPASGLTSDLNMKYFGGTSPHYSVDRIGSFCCEPLFACESGYGRMYMNHGENYNTVASSVVLGAMANGDSLNLKPFIAGEIVNFFMGYDPTVNVNDPASGVPAAAAFPNPCAGATVLHISTPARSPLKVDIFDQKGRLVKRLAETDAPAQEHILHWDGSGNDGLPVKNGLYIFRIEAAGKVSTAKVMVIR